MFGDGFPTENGKAKFVAAEHTGADELPDGAYPFILVTGRVLEHWHTGVMTRRSKTLHERKPRRLSRSTPTTARRLAFATGRWST